MSQGEAKTSETRRKSVSALYGLTPCVVVGRFGAIPRRRNLPDGADEALLGASPDCLVEAPPPVVAGLAVQGAPINEGRLAALGAGIVVDLVVANLADRIAAAVLELSGVGARWVAGLHAAAHVVKLGVGKVVALFV